MEQRWVQLDPTTHRRHGMLATIQRATGIKRQTMSKWWRGQSEPGMAAYTALAEILQVSRADLVAAFDDTPRDRGLPEILSDDERRRRRKWWLGIARLTAGLGLTTARDAFAERGIRSGRGNLAALWEDPSSGLLPTPAQLRIVAEVYRLPMEELADLWNSPPATDEEEMAERRGVELELVREPDVELPAESVRRSA